jgi:rhamnosyltransferase
MNTLNPNQICCLIVTYNPDDELLSIINIIKFQVGKTIIVDNKSEGKGAAIVSHIAEMDKVFLLRNKVNVGIAKALNQGVGLAKKMGYEWVLTFDQDTTPFHNIIEIMSEVYTLYPEKQKIGAIGVNFSSEDSGDYYRFNTGKIYHERDYLITSGCLLSIKAFNEIGGFREDLFIDNVDLEYSLRLKEYGKVSIITKKWGMRHKAGDPKTKKFWGISLVSSNHSSLRRYYMARNHVILSKEYIFRNPYFILKLNIFFFLSLISILLAEDNKISKLSASFKGMLDGVHYTSKYKIL